MARILRQTAIVFCTLPFLAVAATAHVRAPGAPGYNPLDRTMEAAQQGIGHGLARPGPACGLWADARRLSANATLAASVPGATPLSEVRLDSVRATAAVYREVLSLLDGFDAASGIAASGIAASDIVHVAEGVTPDGASCPLYVAVGRDESRQTFWRFAPDDEPEGWFDEQGRRLGDALATPRPGSRISSPFGPRRYYGRLSGGGFHDGIDYESRVGEPIFAAADGIVELRGGHFEYGLTVKIRHAARYTTLYAHMSRFANGIDVGVPVHKGELIGYVGMTGRSTGAHLHFSTIANGRFVDPASYLSSNGTHSLSAPTLATFRKWQEEVRAAVTGARDRKLRPQPDESDWTTRI